MSLLPFKFMAKAYNKRQVNMEKRYFVFYDIGPSKEMKSQRSEKHVCFDAWVCDRVDSHGETYLARLCSDPSCPSKRRTGFPAFPPGSSPVKSGLGNSLDRRATEPLLAWYLLDCPD